MKLHLGVRILELLEASNTLTTQTGPQAHVHDDTLVVGPGLIGQHEALTYELLVDGDPHLTIDQMLIDVEIEEIDPDQERVAISVALAGLKVVLGSMALPAGISVRK